MSEQLCPARSASWPAGSSNSPSRPRVVQAPLRNEQIAVAAGGVQVLGRGAGLGRVGRVWYLSEQHKEGWECVTASGSAPASVGERGGSAGRSRAAASCRGVAVRATASTSWRSGCVGTRLRPVSGQLVDMAARIDGRCSTNSTGRSRRRGRRRCGADLHDLDMRAVALVLAGLALSLYSTGERPTPASRRRTSRRQPRSWRGCGGAIAVAEAAV